VVWSAAQVGEFADNLHAISVAGRKSVDPQRWQPMAPGSWEQGTTVLPGESALEVIQQVEKELSAEQGVGGASEPSHLLSPAARDMIIQSEARIAQIEGRPPPKPAHDELAELLALRAEQASHTRDSSSVLPGGRSFAGSDCLVGLAVPPHALSPPPPVCAPVLLSSAGRTRTRIESRKDGSRGFGCSSTSRREQGRETTAARALLRQPALVAERALLPVPRCSSMPEALRH
jgi:hypothetical protein